MYLEAIFSFYVLLYHFVGHSFFGLIFFGSFSDIIKRNFSLTLAKLNFYVDMSVWLFVGKQYYRLNALTGADILAEDKLFATLDPTTRSLKLPSGQEILLTDTVGFIRKLPHHLIDAFKSTLEEAKYADMILHVVDVSNPQADEQMFTVYETLQGLKVQDKPIITVFNKQDRLEGIPVIRDFKADYTVSISAKTKAGLGDLLETIEALLRQQKVYIEEVYPYSEAGKIQLIRKYGELLEENYTEEGIQVTAYVPADIYPQIVVNR